MTEHVHSLCQQITSFLEQHGVHSCTMVVAVSGGLDSVALLRCLHELRSTFDLDLHVAHVHHGMRGSEADEDENFVRSLAMDLGLPYSCTHVDVPGARTQRTNGSVERIARDLRYTALTTVSESVHAQYLAVAHTADDVAETFLMHLARGSGLAGLSSLPQVRQHGPVQIVRPLHGVERALIELVAQEQNWGWRTDTTNTDQRYLRNRVRHVAIPALQEVFGQRMCASIHRSAELLRASQDVMDAALHPVVQTVVASLDHGVLLKQAAVDDLDPVLIPEVIRRAVAPLAPYPLSFLDLQRICSLIEAPVGTRASLRQGLQALKDRDGLVVEAASVMHDGEPSVIISTPGSYNLGGQTLRVDGKLTDFPISLEWRFWHAGDRCNGYLVSDTLSQAKVPHRYRSLITVVCVGDHVRWICGLPDDHYTCQVAGENVTFTHLP